MIPGVARASLDFAVIDQPLSQGSHIPRRGKEGRCICVPANPRELVAWRGEIARCAREAMAGEPGFAKDVGVELTVVFWLPRPPSVPERKRELPVVHPDLDKLLRAVGDALQNARVIHNDAQITSLGRTRKRYARPDQPVGIEVSLSIDDGE